MSLAWPRLAVRLPLLKITRAMSSSSGSVATSAFISQQLSRYSACDISDALLKLKVPGAGYLADLRAISSTDALTIAPVSTILFAAKGHVEDEATLAVPANVPKDTHWADLTEPDTFVVMKQPPGQTNAICGGIMALRMKVRGVKGIIVAGRVRDVQELQSTNLPVIMSPLPSRSSILKREEQHSHTDRSWLLASLRLERAGAAFPGRFRCLWRSMVSS